MSTIKRLGVPQIKKLGLQAASEFNQNINEERLKKKDIEDAATKNLLRNNKTFFDIVSSAIKLNPDIKIPRLREFYEQIIKDKGELLKVDERVKKIYKDLLNYRVPEKAINRLKEIGGHIQYINGNDDIQSKLVNMDYFSVRIDKMPVFNDGVNTEVSMLFKKIRDNFLKLSKGSITFESNCELPFNGLLGNSVKGNWEFIPYPKSPNEELKRWERQLGSAIFKIKAGGGLKEYLFGDDGAVLESEVSQNSWIFTTIFTPETDTQPFSGHRQFGIHKDEDGNYRFFARAIDRIWPSEFIAKHTGKECSVLNYLVIADATWNNLIKNVSRFINENGGKTTIMPPEIKRVNFNIFFKKFRSNKPVNFIGNVEQYQ